MTRTGMKTLAVLMTAGIALSGCVNVLPKTKPIQLYRFGYAPEVKKSDKDEAPVAPPVNGAAMPVQLGQIDFPQEAGSDRVLTTEGNEVAYAGGARWAAPASELFQDAVKEGFSRSATTVRLDRRGGSNTSYRLEMVVHHFESAYKRGRPTVSIALDARLVRLSDRSVVGQRYITADVGVRHNDMSLMADAYDQATTEVVQALVGFTQETVAANPLPDTQVKP
ncbi:ABC-type transport auxiliary lipoprotein family protein [Asticcacaulis solisilvae]|uniref:ABC-type transport auxiliary lipoprotein family protein n=1 Tax=Asticcacaulis solisilvae TaxID=1217274 RepID=UPI003FD776E5